MREVFISADPPELRQPDTLGPLARDRHQHLAGVPILASAGEIARRDDMGVVR
jgi:hypothetical protein